MRRVYAAYRLRYLAKRAPQITVMIKAERSYRTLPRVAIPVFLRFARENRSESDGSSSKNKKDEPPEWVSRGRIAQTTRVFAYGEDSRSLRLKSKLFDLREANANRFSCATRAKTDPSPMVAAPKTKKTSHPNGYLVFLELLPGFGPGTSSLPRMCSTS